MGFFILIIITCGVFAGFFAGALLKFHRTFHLMRNYLTCKVLRRTFKKSLEELLTDKDPFCRAYAKCIQNGVDQKNMKGFWEEYTTKQSYYSDSENQFWLTFWKMVFITTLLIIGISLAFVYLRDEQFLNRGYAQHLEMVNSPQIRRIWVAQD